jgi:hypothetical protein
VVVSRIRWESGFLGGHRVDGRTLAFTQLHELYDLPKVREPISGDGL